MISWERHCVWGSDNFGDKLTGSFFPEFFFGYCRGTEGEVFSLVGVLGFEIFLGYIFKLDEFSLLIVREDPFEATTS